MQPPCPCGRPLPPVHLRCLACARRLCLDCPEQTGCRAHALALVDPPFSRIRPQQD
jgi:hypothetical protein